MPSIRYMNQSAPFWDFIASLEDQNTSRPRPEHFNPSEPFGWGWQPHHWGHGPPPSPPHRRADHDNSGEGSSHPPPPHHEHTGEKPSDAGSPTSPSEDHNGPGGPPPYHQGPGPRDGPHPHRPHPHHRHEGPGARGRGRCGGRGGFGGPRGGFGGPRHRGPPPFGPFGGLGALANLFNPAMFETSNDATNENEAETPTKLASSDDFTPEADVFDTEASFVIHVSLPGAKKEDIGVNWEAEKSELVISGVLYRPGDEDFLKTLALDERKVGAFERKVRLGSRASPAQVDADGIGAKLEDGILRIEVPKLDKDYIEIKKVDIE